jgi:methionyl-tRNA formyltransferase
MKTIIMANGNVGLEIIKWLLKNYRDDIGLIITTSEDKIWHVTHQAGLTPLVFSSSPQFLECINSSQIKFDVGLLLWWPHIIKAPLISIPAHGFINTHPSFLPYNRGKHYNFWALVEEAPFGVSLHFINEGIDTGDVIAQRRIYYDWEDNGASLYSKAQENMIEILKETYPKIRGLDRIARHKQNLSLGSFHLSGEIDKASFIDLDKSYRAKDLINLLRARTFPGYPACWFEDNGQEYEIRVEIRRKLP